jgi:hypothetical protein
MVPTSIKSIQVILFFVSYLIILVYLVLNMKLAAVYDSWSEVPYDETTSNLNEPILITADGFMVVRFTRNSSKTRVFVVTWR